MFAAARNLQASDFARASAELDSVPESRRRWAWHRLRYEVDSAPRRIGALGTHGWGVLDAVVSPDETQFVTAALDGRVIVWDLQTWQSRPIGPAPFRELVHGSWSEMHLQWRSALWPLRDEPDTALAADCFLALAWPEKTRSVIGASLHGRGVAWTLPSGEEETIVEHDQPLCALAVDPQGNECLFGDDQSLLIHARTADNPPKITRHSLLAQNAILDVIRVSPRLYVTAQQNGDVTRIDLQSDAIMQQLRLPGCVWDLDWDTEDQMLATGCDDGTLRTYHLDTKANSLLFTADYRLPPHYDSAPVKALHRVRIDPFHGRLVAGDAIGRVLAWNGDDGSMVLVDVENQPASRNNPLPNPAPIVVHRSITALQLTDQGNRALIGGWSCSIGHWTLSGSKGVDSLRVRTDPSMKFDPREPNRLWVVSGGTSLAIWDVDNLTEIDHREFPTKQRTSFDLASEAGIAVVGHGASIFFCQMLKGRIVTRRDAIQHTAPLRDVAISHDASFLAAYDCNDRVLLWDVQSGKLLKSCDMSADMPTQKGQLAFDSTGSRLAAGGPGQRLWILEIPSLRVLRRIAGISGEGVTALAWDRHDTDTLFSGDQRGAVRGWKVTPNSRLLGTRLSRPIAGLAATPSGNRFATIDESGTFRVVDPVHAGDLVERSLICTSPENRPTCLDFDAAGRFLAIALSNGAIEVWKTEFEGNNQTLVPTRHWTSQTVIEGAEARSVFLRPPSVGIDSEDRVWIVYSTMPDGVRQVVHVAWPTEHGYATKQLDDIDLASVRHPHDIEASLAVLVRQGDVWAAYRKPRPDKEAYGAQIAGFTTTPKCLDGSRSPIQDWHGLVFSDLIKNYGDRLHLLPGPNRKPLALHINWDGYYLMSPWWTGEDWKHEIIGHHGDGFHVNAAVSR